MPYLIPAVMDPLVDSDEDNDDDKDFEESVAMMTMDCHFPGVAAGGLIDQDTEPIVRKERDSNKSGNLYLEQNLFEGMHFDEECAYSEREFERSFRMTL